MSLIISQTGVSRLPAELVNNAAFVKQVDFDPVHQTAEIDQPAEKVNGIANRFDTISISEEALAQAKDITDPAYVERRKQGDALGRAMSSWNAAVERLKQTSESSKAYGYAETIKLFQNGYADWRTALQKSDPEAYGAWIRMIKGNE